MRQQAGSTAATGHRRFRKTWTTVHAVREWFFIFAVPYGESAVPELQKNAVYTSDSTTANDLGRLTNAYECVGLHR